MKLSFRNDYSEGCHPQILDALIKHNYDQQNGYGLDAYSDQAREFIQNKIKSPSSTIHFVSGGTQANLIVISALLRPHESVISARTGHIFEHEAGAIESTGHKINTIETGEGKLSPNDIQKIIDSHLVIPHQVKPKLVYISNSTELGTTYSKRELTELSNICKEKDLFLFMDGARLGHALSSSDNDLTLENIAQLTDVFYIGGTKNGALLGEAIILNNTNVQEDFSYTLKQKGALLSKGRLIGIQFLELFRDDLYFELSSKANQQAMKIKRACIKKGFPFWVETTTNQIFPILKNQQINKLLDYFDFYIWHKVDEEHSAIRIITSWASADENVNLFISKLLEL